MRYSRKEHTLFNSEISDSNFALLPTKFVTDFGSESQVLPQNNRPVDGKRDRPCEIYWVNQDTP